MKTRKYLDKDDKLFWQKLLYEMPDQGVGENNEIEEEGPFLKRRNYRPRSDSGSSLSGFWDFEERIMKEHRNSGQDDDEIAPNEDPRASLLYKIQDEAPMAVHRYQGERNHHAAGAVAHASLTSDDDRDSGEQGSDADTENSSGSAAVSSLESLEIETEF